MYTYTHYIHCTYIEDINTCTFIQSYKPINLYTMRWRELRAGHADVHGGGRHTGRSRACVQETQIYRIDYKFTSKLRHFQRAIQSREWKWESSKGASALPAQTVPQSKGHWPPKIKENVRWWYFPWPGLRVEMWHIAPLHIRSFHWKGGHKLLDSNQVLELGSTAKGCLSGRGQAGSENALLETPPKD